MGGEQEQTAADGGDRRPGRPLDRRVRAPVARVHRPGPVPRRRRPLEAAPAVAAQPARCAVGRAAAGRGRRRSARSGSPSPRCAPSWRPSTSSSRCSSGSSTRSSTGAPPGPGSRWPSATSSGRTARHGEEHGREGPPARCAAGSSVVVVPGLRRSIPVTEPDPRLGLAQPVDQRHEVLLDPAQRVRHGVDGGVVEHPARPARCPGLQRPHRLLELFDEVLEPLGDPLGRLDGLVRHRRRLGQLPHRPVQVAEGARQLGQRLGLRLQEGQQLAEPGDARHPEPTERVHAATVGDRDGARNLRSAGRAQSQVMTRTVVPRSEDRSCTRSHSWLTR